MRIVKLSLKNSKYGVIDCPDILPIIRDRLSVVNESARFAKVKYTQPSRIYTITPSGRFNIGLFKTIKNVIDSLDIIVKYEYTDEFKSACMPFFTCRNEPLPIFNITPYDYQEKAVKKMLSMGRGVILIGTGGGKTFIMSLLVKMALDGNKGLKTLIIVPTLQLVEQTYSDFIEYGFDESEISKWSGKYDRKDTNIIVANTSILLSKNSDIGFLQNIGLLVVDEVHIIKRANNINKIVDKIPTYNKFGFTGTMPEDPIDQWNVLGKIGPIIFEKNSDSLRKGKFISNVKIIVLKINYNIDTLAEMHDAMRNDPNKYMAEVDFVVHNEYRNNLICNSAKVCRGNSLIMVDRIEHGELLYELLKDDLGDKVYFIQGSVDVNIREEIRDLMESTSGIICIAISKIFSTGINIKNIHNIMFATPGKAKVKLIQSIGRGLRLHETKSILRVIDFTDDLHYSNRHLRKRLKLYHSEKLGYETRSIRQPHDS